MSPTNEHREEMKREFGDQDFVYIEAQHAQVGMLAYHPGARGSKAWKRIVKVQPIYKGVCLHFDDGQQLQRDPMNAILINASDLPTAFAISKCSVRTESLADDSLKRMRQKLMADLDAT